VAVPVQGVLNKESSSITASSKLRVGSKAAKKSNRGLKKDRQRLVIGRKERIAAYVEMMKQEDEWRKSPTSVDIVNLYHLGIRHIGHRHEGDHALDLCHNPWNILSHPDDNLSPCYHARYLGDLCLYFYPSCGLSLW